MLGVTLGSGYQRIPSSEEKLFTQVALLVNGTAEI